MALALAIQCPFHFHALDEAARLGLRHIQLRIGPGFPIATDRDDLDEARHASDELNRRGLAVVALGCYRNVASPERGERDEEIERLRRVMRMAPLFGTDLVGVFAGRDPDRSLEANLPRFAAVWEPIAAEAEGLGVRLAFENCTMLRGDPPRGINLAMTPHIVDRMFDAVPSSVLGLELDPSHLAKQWIDPLAVARRFADRIYHVHAKDHESLPDQLSEHGRFDLRASRDRLPGRGSIDFASFFATLTGLGYAGAVTFEPERGIDLPQDLPADDRLEALGQAVRYLEGALGGPPMPSRSS